VLLPFDAQAVGYRQANALVLGRAALAAYRDRDEARRMAIEWGHGPLAFFGKDSARGFVGSGGHWTLVSFRGMKFSRIGDWLTDFNVSLQAGPAGMVHSGFAQSLDGVWDELLAAIDAAGDHGRPLWFTGHSLGAALATLAVARLRVVGRPVAGLCTFGSPAVGDKAFARAFDADFGLRTCRFVNQNDVATSFPFRQFAYRHVGQLKYFDAQGRLHDGRPRWSGFLAGRATAHIVHRMAMARGRLDRVAAVLGSLAQRYREAHRMERYVELIASLGRT